MTILDNYVIIIISTTFFLAFLFSSSSSMKEIDALLGKVTYFSDSNFQKKVRKEEGKQSYVVEFFRYFTHLEPTHLELQLCCF